MEYNAINNLVKNNDGGYFDISDEKESCFIKQKERVKQVSDFCTLNGCSTFKINGKKVAKYALKDTENKYEKHECYPIVDEFGKLNTAGVNSTNIGVAPIINFDIPNKEELKNYRNNFGLFKGIFARLKKRNPIINVGEYPQNLVDDDTADYLEYLYNYNVNKLHSTGKLYSINSFSNTEHNFLTKQCPEFKINGKKYVRLSKGHGLYNLDGETRIFNQPLWFEVKPIKFVVKNWEEMPKYMNPTGNGRSTTMKLESQKIVFSGIPYYEESFNNNKTDRNWGNSFLKYYLNDNNLVNEVFNDDYDNSKKVVIPVWQNIIPTHAFDGCVSLQEIVIHNKVKSINSNIFGGCHFRYIYQMGDNTVLTNNFPKDLTNVKNLIDFDDFKSVIKDITYEDLLKRYLKTDKTNVAINDYIKLFVKLKKSDLVMSKYFIAKYESMFMFERLLQYDYRFIKNELPNLKNMLNDRHISYTNRFIDFMAYLGCFSRDKWLDSSGKETDVLLGQKASSFVGNLIKYGVFNIDDVNLYLNDSVFLSYNSKPNQDLIKFLSTKDQDGKYKNIEILKGMESEKMGAFANALQNFDVAKQMRKQINENGKIKMLSWEDALKKANSIKSYANVNADNYKMAELYASRGIADNLFNQANDLYLKAKSNNIPNHILSGPLKELTYQEQIDAYTEEIRHGLIEAHADLCEAFCKEFTYEFLEKSDPRNAIIGQYCDCCAIVGNFVYGSEIATATITAPDVQNLVIRDNKNEIIAKASMYVNKKYGYIVLNEFDINAKYKKNQSSRGYYSDSVNTKAYKDREKIFEAFMRGIKDFVKQYDIEHPDMPIKKVNVGNGCNRLKLQCNRFRKETENLTVPLLYAFEDAEDYQYILYDREQELKSKQKELKL